MIPDVAPSRPSNVVPLWHLIDHPKKLSGAHIHNSVSFKIPNMSNWGASPIRTIFLLLVLLGDVAAGVAWFCLGMMLSCTLAGVAAVAAVAAADAAAVVTAAGWETLR